jgi:DNA-directed RNA polymerase specialized sigma24 family protein
LDLGSAIGLTDGRLLERFAKTSGGGNNADEAAFETIMARHGATVLTVCRDVLGDEHAAEDAFQATFLVLVRRAGSLRVRDQGSLGPWLYGVAYRTALKARKGAGRRRVREQRTALLEARGEPVVAALERDDLGAALHH